MTFEQFDEYVFKKHRTEFYKLVKDEKSNSESSEQIDGNKIFNDIARKENIIMNADINALKDAIVKNVLKEQTTWSEDLVRKYVDKLVQKEEQKANLIQNASMTDVFNWLKEVQKKNGFDLEDLPFVFVYYKCPYKLTKFCDVEKDEKTNTVRRVSFAVSDNGHSYTYEPGFGCETRFFNEFVEMYI